MPFNSGRIAVSGPNPAGAKEGPSAPSEGRRPLHASSKPGSKVSASLSADQTRGGLRQVGVNPAGLRIARPVRASSATAPPRAHEEGPRVANRSPTAGRRNTRRSRPAPYHERTHVTLRCEKSPNPRLQPRHKNDFETRGATPWAARRCTR